MSFCNEYCYLGVTFSKSGSFKVAAKALTDKATNAMFSLIKNLYKHRSVDVNIMLDLFDKMVVPIALYGVEVWGMNFLPTNKSNKDLFDKSHLGKHLSENLQYRFIKMLLGVPRRTSSWAAVTECGRYPLAIKAFKAMCRYFQHISNTTSPIIKAALDQSKALAGLGVNSWSKSMSRVFEFVGVNKANDSFNYEVELKKKYVEKWIAERNECKKEGKLNILANCKTDLSISYYLLSSHLNKGYQRAITRFRLSAHKFPIEVERYNKTIREERICPFGCGVLGDEAHFIFECEHPAMRGVYKPILFEMGNQYPKMNTFENKQDKLVYMLTSEDIKLLQLVGKLCYKVLNCYKDMLW